MSLRKVYCDSKYTTGFGTVAKLVKAIINKKRDVEEWLSGQNTYTLHKHEFKSFPQYPCMLTNTDEVWEKKLADLSSLLIYNNKYKYLLHVIHTFSRYA